MKRTLDRIIEFDEKSKQFPIRELLPPKAPRSYTWGINTWLDQGQEGACVGFGWAHDLAARPRVEKDVNQPYAENIYHLAQAMDGDHSPHEGSTVLAGAKAVTQLGRIKEYRWAFGLDDVIQTLSYHGPVVLGTNWYNDMFHPDAKGFIHPTGGVAGGHCILIKGVNVKSKYVTLHNSWGKSWGMNGECKVSFDDLQTLLKDQGEACVPVKI